MCDGWVVVTTSCYMSVLNGRKLGENTVEVKPHSQEARGDELYIFDSFL